LSRYDVSIVNPHIWGEPATANLAANNEASAAWFTVDDLTRLGIHSTQLNPPAHRLGNLR